MRVCKVMLSCPYWGGGDIAPRIIELGTEGGKWSASRSGRFTPRERDHGTHWIGSWVGPRAALDTVVKRKIPGLFLTGRTNMEFYVLYLATTYYCNLITILISYSD
jgi:hypothetical protein